MPFPSLFGLKETVTTTLKGAVDGIKDVSSQRYKALKYSITSSTQKISSSIGKTYAYGKERIFTGKNAALNTLEKGKVKVKQTISQIPNKTGQIVRSGLSKSADAVVTCIGNAAIASLKTGFFITEKSLDAMNYVTPAVVKVGQKVADTKRATTKVLSSTYVKSKELAKEGISKGTDIAIESAARSTMVAIETGTVLLETAIGALTPITRSVSKTIGKTLLGDGILLPSDPYGLKPPHVIKIEESKTYISLKESTPSPSPVSLSEEQINSEIEKNYSRQNIESAKSKVNNLLEEKIYQPASSYLSYFLYFSNCLNLSLDNDGVFNNALLEAVESSRNRDGTYTVKRSIFINVLNKHLKKLNKPTITFRQKIKIFFYNLVTEKLVKSILPIISKSIVNTIFEQLFNNNGEGQTEVINKIISELGNYLKTYLTYFKKINEQSTDVANTKRSLAKKIKSEKMLGQIEHNGNQIDLTFNKLFEDFAHFLINKVTLHPKDIFTIYLSNIKNSKRWYSKILYGMILFASKLFIRENTFENIKDYLIDLVKVNIQPTIESTINLLNDKTIQNTTYKALYRNFLEVKYSCLNSVTTTTSPPSKITTDDEFKKGIKNIGKICSELLKQMTKDFKTTNKDRRTIKLLDALGKVSSRFSYSSIFGKIFEIIYTSNLPEILQKEVFDKYLQPDAFADTLQLIIDSSSDSFISKKSPKEKIEIEIKALEKLINSNNNLSHQAIEDLKTIVEFLKHDLIDDIVENNDEQSNEFTLKTDINNDLLIECLNELEKMAFNSNNKDDRTALFSILSELINTTLDIQIEYKKELKEFISLTLNSTVYEYIIPIFKDRQIPLMNEVIGKRKKEILEKHQNKYSDISKYIHDLFAPLLNEQLQKGIDLMFDPSFIQIAYNSLLLAAVR